VEETTRLFIYILFTRTWDFKDVPDFNQISLPHICKLIVNVFSSFLGQLSSHSRVSKIQPQVGNGQPGEKLPAAKFNYY
jgi:hypothetical protein